MDPLADIRARLAAHIARLAAVGPIHLVACPFCGGPAELDWINPYWFGKCLDAGRCGCSGPLRMTAPEAAAAWNTRPVERAAGPPRPPVLN